MSVILWPVYLVVTLVVSYFGAKLILPEVPPMVPCNFEMQSFDIEGVPIYWQVEEGQCPAGDPNFDAFIPEILDFFPLFNMEEWPKSKCVANPNGLFPLAVKFGTDLYDVEELDCKQQLEVKTRLEEEKFDLKEYIRGNLKQQGGNIGTNLLMKALGA